MMYATNKRLRELIVEARSTGVFPEELALIVVKMAEGLHGRYHFPVDKDDFKQECVLLVMVKLHRIKLDGSIFNFLTSCCLNHFKQRYRAKVSKTVQDYKMWDRRRHEDGWDRLSDTPKKCKNCDF